MAPLSSLITHRVLNALSGKESDWRLVVSETQPQLMLGYGGTAAPPPAGAFNNTYAGMPSYQGYSM